MLRAIIARVFETPEYHRACDVFLERLDLELTTMAHGILEALCAGEAQYAPDMKVDTFRRVGAIDDQTRRKFLALFDRSDAASELCRLAPAFNRPMSRTATSFLDQMEQAHAIMTSRWFRLEEFLVDPAVRMRIGGEVPTEHLRLLGCMLELLRVGDQVLERNHYVKAVIEILERQALDAARHVVVRGRR